MSLVLVVDLRALQFNDVLLFFRDFFLELADLVDYFVEALLSFQKFSAYLARTDLRVQQFLVLLLNLLHVFLVFDLQLVEIDELELVAHLLLLRDLVGSLDYLGR